MSCCSECAKHGCECGCGGRRGTPLGLYNRPGLARLGYRVGAYADFYQTMKAGLSDSALPALAGLRTRDTNDPAMALLDAWAVGADVLSFYQERIANEGYLPTASERRSVLELGRLVDYRVRPGVSASAYLAYTVDKGSAPVTIPAGTRSQSIPAPGEQMQSFETSEPLEARYEWNALRPRLQRPQNITPGTVGLVGEVWFKGTSTGLKLNDRLLFMFGDVGDGVQAVRLVQSVEALQDSNRTRVVLQPLDPPAAEVLSLIEIALAGIAASGTPEKQAGLLRDYFLLGRQWLLLGAEVPSPENFPLFPGGLSGDLAKTLKSVYDGFVTGLNSVLAPPGDTAAPQASPAFAGLVAALRALPSAQPASRFRLSRDAATALGRASDARPQLLLKFEKRLADTLYPAWTSAPNRRVSPQLTGVYALRLAAPLFGYNAPPILGFKKLFDQPVGTKLASLSTTEGDWTSVEDPDRIQLDNAYDGVRAGSYLLIQSVMNRDPKGPADQADLPIALVAKARTVHVHPRTDYVISGKTTDIELTNPIPGQTVPLWAKPTMRTLRRTQVFAQSELLQLAEETIDATVGHDPDDPAAAKRIALDVAVDGLAAGRWVIVEGRRTDVDPEIQSVTAAELVMIEAVEQGLDASLPGDTVHSTLVLAEKGLAYSYQRDTMHIYANVVRATHGESRTEAPVNGDAAVPMQSFTLKQSPLTHVSAATPDGIQSSLTVRVNDVEWHETRNLAFVGPNGRNFVTSMDDDAKTTVVFGDGEHGARLPTGFQNVKATYRNGIGTAGNVRAQQISLIATRPPGVKAVINPIRASGGADAETRDQARRNVPLAVLALDRLVSVPDYADFARTFGGVGKAAARKLGTRVQVTIAGAADAPIDTTSDLHRNLLDALRRYGDPTLAVQLDVRELLALTLSANVGLAPDYAWDKVEPRVRSALVEAFGFENRRLAQAACLSEVVACIHAVRGVAWVDVDAFGSLDEATILAGFADESGDDAGSGGGKLLGAGAPRAPHSTSTTEGPPARVEARPARYGPGGTLLPAQLACLLPEVPDTLILQEARP